MTIKLTISAALGDYELEAARGVIARGNRTQETQLPEETPAEIKASLAIVLAAELAAKWEKQVDTVAGNHLRQANVARRFRDATPAKRKAALDALG